MAITVVTGDRGRGYFSVFDTYYPCPGVTAIDLADGGTTGGETTIGLEDEYTSAGSPTAGSMGFTLDLLSGSQLLRQLSRMEGQSINCVVVFGGVPTVKVKSNTGHSVSINTSGTLTFIGDNGPIKAATSELGTPIAKEDALLVLKTPGGAAKWADSTDEDMVDVYSIRNVGALGHVYPWNNSGEKLSAVVPAGAYAIVTPQLRARFSATIVNSRGLSVTGKTTPGSRTLTLQPATSPEFELIPSVQRYIQS